MLRLKAALFAALATLALMAAACGGGSGGNSGSEGNDGNGGSAESGNTGGDKNTRDEPDLSDLLVSNAGAALGKSADAFEQDVDSFQAEISFSFDIGEVSMTGTGAFSYQAPGQLYMTMSFGDGGDSGIDLSQLGNFEMLFTGGRFYMNTGITGWVTMSLEDLGVGAADFSELLESNSPVDYEALVDSAIGDILYIGEEEIDGQTVVHYRLTVDLADMMDALSAMGDTGLNPDELGAADMTGNMFFDAWVDTETLLPAKMTITGNASVDGETMTMDMEMRFSGYNEPVEIPAPPADATSFEEMFEGLGLDEDFGFGEELDMEDIFGGSGQ